MSKWNNALPMEVEALLCDYAGKLAAANERIAELEKERDYWIHHRNSERERVSELEKERDEHAGTAQALERQLAESQAREAKLREALGQADEAIDFLSHHLRAHHKCIHMEDGARIKQWAGNAARALALPHDDSALRQAIATELRRMAGKIECIHCNELIHRADELEGVK